MTGDTSSFLAGLSAGSMLLLFVHLCGGSVPAVAVGIHAAVVMAWAYHAFAAPARPGPAERRT